MPRPDVPKSNLDIHGVPGKVVSAAVMTLLESVLDEIDCVDDFGPESEDPGGDSETCPGAEGPAPKRPKGPLATTVVVSEDGGIPSEPKGSRSETPDAER